MVIEQERNCPGCGGELKYYDSVKRIVRTKYRRTEWIKVKRLRCRVCGEIHRVIPKFIFPYKQYEAEVIIGVIEGLISSETLGFEDYPCEMTMKRWRTRNLQTLL